MLRIHDIMNRDVFTLSARTPLDDAAWSLAIRGVSAAPVRDGQGLLVGMLSRTELLEPRGSDGREPPRLVKDAMTPTVMLLSQDEPAMAAVRAIVEEGAPQVVVLDGDGEVVGVVTAMDVLRALVRGDRFGVGRPDEDEEDVAERSTEASDTVSPEGAPAY